MADSDFAKKASDVDSPCHGEEGGEEKKRGLTQTHATGGNEL